VIEVPPASRTVTDDTVAGTTPAKRTFLAEESEPGISSIAPSSTESLFEQLYASGGRSLVSSGLRAARAQIPPSGSRAIHIDRPAEPASRGRIVFAFGRCAERASSGTVAAYAGQSASAACSGVAAIVSPGPLADSSAGYSEKALALAAPLPSSLRTSATVPAIAMGTRTIIVALFRSR
jgi:hypothetical protein